jgi:hypothetical protein
MRSKGALLRLLAMLAILHLYLGLTWSQEEYSEADAETADPIEIGLAPTDPMAPPELGEEAEPGDPLTIPLPLRNRETSPTASAALHNWPVLVALLKSVGIEVTGSGSIGDDVTGIREGRGNGIGSGADHICGALVSADPLRSFIEGYVSYGGPECVNSWLPVI